MPLPFEAQEICPKCSWKSKFINTTDCIIGHYGECPKCGAKTKREKPTSWEKFKATLSGLVLLQTDLNGRLF